MYQHLWGLRNRVRRLEHARGFGEDLFTMEDGTRITLTRGEVMEALDEAVHGVSTRRAQVLLQATKASSGCLYQLAQAMHAGPVESAAEEIPHSGEDSGKLDPLLLSS